ncbi:hypothetical protein [Mannheimia pernigra]|uniref:hypothetical protein n=1 Tax=Mannheimia pernigra TaxID=111844 RepID=UPI001317719B|nr:hypothetical protein [Mannheimia pernigra]QHB16948.1 hypothetical protein GM695_02215 [Mannheimia pernigra]
MNTGYEEKTFEIFNIELAKQGSIFPFGQAQEGIFGTDASVNLNATSALWKILNNQPMSANITLNDIEKHLNQTVNKTLSSIKANIFFQYKKPEWVTSPKAHQKNIGEVIIFATIYATLSLKIKRKIIKKSNLIFC